MNSKKNKILFISHDATRTGAPILLLNLAKALKEEYEIDFLLKEGGVLESEFKQHGNTYLVTKTLHKLNRIKFVKRIVKKLFFKSNFQLPNIDWSSYKFILSNTITNGNILSQIKKKYTGKIISYVHELEMATKLYTNTKDVEMLINCTDHFLVPAIAVKNHLIDDLKILERKIGLLHYYIPQFSFVSENSHTGKCFTVGGAGTSDWRKGPDLFILIAKQILTIVPDAEIKFIWKGATIGTLETDRLLYDLRKAGLENYVTFQKSSADIDYFYQELDLFLLTSREDPYPLVVLEAANHGLPTLCFDGVGGAPEFVNAASAGYVAPYLDINTIAQKILHYYNNRSEIRVEGEKARAKLKETHNDKNYILKQFVMQTSQLTY